MQATGLENFFPPAAHADFLKSLASIFVQYRIFDKAADIYGLLYELFPEDTSLGVLFSYALLRKGEASGALEVLKSIRNDQDSEPFIWLLRAQAFSRLSLAAESRRAMRMFIRLKKTNDQRIPASWS